MTSVGDSMHKAGLSYAVLAKRTSPEDFLPFRKLSVQSPSESMPWWLLHLVAECLGVADGTVSSVMIEYIWDKETNFEVTSSFVAAFTP
ncbi:hypothetical protein P3T76_001720 [Phytophthora citrophthora]|uniref:Uncharacterized protein n=1 Tax=Phytophthora citrophthora TaxID=4793 RepID=A0AAD9GZ23_9STRA|nr:hypothetical protein P3T76_001720 [Phytophthora citrophthora]